MMRIGSNIRRALCLVWLSALLAGCAHDSRALVIINNQSACGTIVATLTNSTTGDVKNVPVPVGQSVSTEVQPDTFYEYVIDYRTAGRNAQGQICTLVKSGKVSVPAGTSQTFELDSETPVPTTPQPSLPVTPLSQ